jgi:phytoene synthase
MSASDLHLAAPDSVKRSNLAFALRWLPPERREDAFIFYRFCREVDDIADSTSMPAPQKAELLAQWRQALSLGVDLPDEVARLVSRYSLDPSWLVAIVEGCEQDAFPPHYETWEDLQTYCWRVAAAVGLASSRIFGCQNPASDTYAEALGYALQLTNILRDVSEDASLGRVYLPRQELAAHGVSSESLIAQKPDGDFVGLMRFQSARAWTLFRQAVNSLPDEDRQALRPAELMRAFYQKILQHMDAEGYRVFDKRYRLPIWQKLPLVAQVYLLNQRPPLPEITPVRN